MKPTHPLFRIVTKTMLVVCALWADLLIPTQTAFAQLERERVVVDRPMADIFPAISNIGLGTVRNPSAGSLNLTVAHAFGLVDGGIDRFFGMDDGANTRIGLDYGLTDRFSLGLGRMTFDQVVDLRTTWNLLRQTESGSMPLDLAFKFSGNVRTRTGLGPALGDRMVWFASMQIARKTGRFSLQANPMMAWYGSVFPGDPDHLVGMGIQGIYWISERYALSGEYVPVLGPRPAGTRDAMAVALNIDTGGHTFQIFLTSSQWHNEPFLMSRNRDAFWTGDFRFGFNIHRVFGMTR